MKEKKKPQVRERGWTYQEYSNLPDDGQRYELSDGVLKALSPGPDTIHQMVSRNMEYLLMQKCRSDFILLHAPIDVILSETEVRWKANRIW